MVETRVQKQRRLKFQNSPPWRNLFREVPEPCLLNLYEFLLNKDLLSLLETSKFFQNETTLSHDIENNPRLKGTRVPKSLRRCNLIEYFFFCKLLKQTETARSEELGEARTDLDYLVKAEAQDQSLKKRLDNCGTLRRFLRHFSAG